MSIVLLLTWSCQRNESVNESVITVLHEKNNINFEASSIVNNEFNNYSWLVDNTWIFESGYYEPYNLLLFRKLELPIDSVLYQYRLRNDRFTLKYQTKKEDILYRIENEFSNDIENIEFNDDFSLLTLRKDKYVTGRQNRVGKQENTGYPLVGIWGELPHLTEYRLIDPSGCLYYMEITEPDIGWGLPDDNPILMGTYLLKQTGNGTFETVSSFPDGNFKIERTAPRKIMLTPLFKLPDEVGSIRPMILNQE